MAEEKEVNILKHVLVPKHTIISEDEIKALLEKYNITIKQIPKILHKDATVKALGAKPGEVIRIDRPSPTAGHTTYYRLVVK